MQISSQATGGTTSRRVESRESLVCCGFFPADVGANSAYRTTAWIANEKEAFVSPTLISALFFDHRKWREQTFSLQEKFETMVRGMRIQQPWICVGVLNPERFRPDLSNFLSRACAGRKRPDSPWRLATKNGANIRGGTSNFPPLCAGPLPRIAKTLERSCVLRCGDVDNTELCWGCPSRFWSRKSEGETISLLWKQLKQTLFHQVRIWSCQHLFLLR